MAAQPQFFEYTVCEVRKEGLSTIPVAAPDPTDCEVVRFSAAYGLRSIRWVVASLVEWPDLPAFYGVTANRVPDSSEIYFHSPVPTGTESRFIFIAHGTYHYTMRKARPADSDFSVGDMPPSIANLGTADKYFPAAKFKRFLDTGSLY